MRSKLLKVTLFIAACAAAASASAQISVTNTYTENFDNIGTALPAGWGVWLDSTTTGNGTAFAWTTTQVANNAGTSATNYFRNLPGASQVWSAGLTTGTDRALGWRGGNANSRDGSITLTFTNTLGWGFSTMSFDIFTPNSTGTAQTFNLEYQIGSSGTFIQLAGKSYTTGTAANPLPITSISLTSVDLAVIGDQAGQVTLRLNNTATTGTGLASVAIDNFSYTATAIPEPSTYAAVFGGAAFALVALRRKKTSCGS